MELQSPNNRKRAGETSDWNKRNGYRCERNLVSGFSRQMHHFSEKVETDHQAVTGSSTLVVQIREILSQLVHTVVIIGRSASAGVKV